MTKQILSPELLTKLGNLKVRARHVVDGVLTGLHKSPHHGSSIEFAEYKEYSPGDEIRHIDWRVYARSDRYYVKKFEDETNLSCYLMVDGSGSMNYGEGESNKFEYAKILAAAFSYLLLRQQDSSGMIGFREKIDFYVPPRSTSGHYLELLESLTRFESHGKTDIVASLTHIAELIRGRNMIVIFSDFFEQGDEVFNLLTQLKARKNDIVLFHILHEDELNLPFDFLTDFEDLESGQNLLADPDNIRKEYIKIFTEFTQKLRQSCLEYGIDYQQVNTKIKPENAMLKFLTKREVLR